MVGIGVNFELGRYHATAWGSHVNAAELDWPPSPWRILRAIYATARCDLALADRWESITEVLDVICRAPAPSYSLPPVTPAHTRHYLPARDHSAAKHSTDKVLDGFLAVDPGAELEVWWEAALGAEQRELLARVIDRVAYLGRSESLCRMRLLDTSAGPAPVDDAVPLERAGDDDAGRLVDLLCVDRRVEEPVLVLEGSVLDIRKARRRLPDGAELVPYRVRAEEQLLPAAPRLRVPVVELVRYRIADSRRPSLRDAVTVCTHLRKAALGRYGEQNHKTVSQVLSGKDEHGRSRRDGHRHAHYLALPDSDGRRIEHLAVWAPEGFSDLDLAALAAIDHLTLRDRPEPLRLALVNVGALAEIQLPRLLGPSPRWRSCTPFALVRHPKRRGGEVRDSPEQQLRAELGRRDLGAELEEVRLVKGPWSRFKRTRPGGKLVSAPGAFGFELVFERPVHGPISLGALSHFGLGLLLAQS